MLFAAGLPMSSASALLDLTWDAAYAALDCLSDEALHLVALGRALDQLPFDEPCRGWWSVQRLRVGRWSLGMQLKEASSQEAELRLDLDAAPVAPVVAGEFDSDRDLVRLNVALVLAVVLTQDVPPERFLATACALALLAVLDPRFAPLRSHLKGDALLRAGKALGKVGDRLRELLLQLRYEDRPGAELLGRLQSAFEELLAQPANATSGTLVLREGPGGFEVALGERTCRVSDLEAEYLCKLPPPDAQPVFGVKALCKLWDLGERQDRSASSRYSQLAHKLLHQLGVQCLLKVPRGGRFGLRLRARGGLIGTARPTGSWPPSRSDFRVAHERPPRARARFAYS